ncbi:cobalamin-binding protein [Neisseriaceae bacterium TC5R-5]|nr:cobalamin-binding protein [Neisseriaceae bacterium TC5R-5]
MWPRLTRPGFVSICLLFSLPIQASVSAQDARGQTVTLPHPAQRIVSLIPHTTEMLYAIGAGDRVVATVQYSDYPEAAKRLPRIGSFSGLSLEAILRQKPDLVVAWHAGGFPRELERLPRLGIPVFISHPVQIDDVAKEMLALGKLTASDKGAEKIAEQYRQQFTSLSQRYSQRRPVRVFYQLSQNPIFTISDQSFIGPLIRLCSGQNIFATAKLPAPQVSPAAVISAQPQVILATDQASLDQWLRWRALPAVANKALFIQRGEILHRPGPRLAQGVEQLCRTLDSARQQLGLTIK